MSARVEAYTKKSAGTIVETPAGIFGPLNAEFGFTVDVCALASNAKCRRFFSPEEDGLAQDWSREVCWCNPPYGREIREWISKAHAESLKGATVVCLVPARTDSGWWHDHVEKASECRFLRGRVKFVGMPYNAPFPCAVVVFRPFGQKTINPEAA